MIFKAVYIILLLVVGTAVSSGIKSQSPDSLNLDDEKGFNRIDPDDWTFMSQREEIAPVHSLSNQGLFKGATTLTLAGGGKEYANGCWYTVKDVQSGGYYRFQVFFHAEMVEQ